MCACAELIILFQCCIKQTSIENNLCSGESILTKTQRIFEQVCSTIFICSDEWCYTVAVWCTMVWPPTDTSTSSTMALTRDPLLFNKPNLPLLGSTNFFLCSRSLSACRQHQEWIGAPKIIDINKIFLNGIICVNDHNFVVGTHVREITAHVWHRVSVII